MSLLGYSFPFKIINDLEIASEEDLIARDIIQLLGTEYGERVMRPSFGSKLKDLIGVLEENIVISLAKYYISSSIKKWEDRIENITIDVKLNKEERKLEIFFEGRKKLSFKPIKVKVLFPLE